MTTPTAALKLEAAGKLACYLKTGLAGFYQQAWDRLANTGLDVAALRQPSYANARTLLAMANEQQPPPTPAQQRIAEKVANILAAALRPQYRSAGDMASNDPQGWREEEARLFGWASQRSR